MSKRRLASVLYLLPIVLSDRAYAGGWLLPEGSYEIAFRLELPHLERWAVDKKTLACVSEGKGATSALAPILSDNNPFAGCSAEATLPRTEQPVKEDPTARRGDPRRGTSFR